MQPAEKFEDLDALETREWLDALQAVIEQEGPGRAHYLLEKLIDKARRSGAYLPYSLNTAYVNTIPAGNQAPALRTGDVGQRAAGLVHVREGDPDGEQPRAGVLPSAKSAAGELPTSTRWW